MTKINYPSEWDDIVEVKVIAKKEEDDHLNKTYSNFCGEFVGTKSDVEEFCNELADTGKYATISVTCYSSD